MARRKAHQTSRYESSKQYLEHEADQPLAEVTVELSSCPTSWYEVGCSCPGWQVGTVGWMWCNEVGGVGAAWGSWQVF